MKNLIIYLISFIIILLVFFTEKKEKTKFTPLEGTIYTQSSQNLHKKSTKSPHIDAKEPSEISLETEARRYDSQNRNYEVKDFMQDNTVKIRGKRESVPSVVSEDKILTNNEFVKKEIPPDNTVEIEEISFKALTDAIEASTKNYYFTGNSKTIRDVTVTVYSITPYNDRNILKIKVRNDQKDYFFISGIEINTDKKPIEIKTYSEPLVAPNRTLEALVLLQKYDNREYMLKLTESSGKNRTFIVKFKIP